MRLHHSDAQLCEHPGWELMPPGNAKHGHKHAFALHGAMQNLLPHHCGKLKPQTSPVSMSRITLPLWISTIPFL